MEAPKDFDLFTQKYKRDINCLTDENIYIFLFF